MTDKENRLTLETTKGNVVIALRPDLAPKHVERITTLVKEGFYDGIVFHRVIDGFMAQTGCPHGTGTGGSEYPNLRPSSTPSRMCAAPPRWRARRARIARTASSSSASTTPASSTSNTPCGARWWKAWRTSTRITEKGEPVQNPDKIVKATIGA